MRDNEQWYIYENPKIGDTLHLKSNYDFSRLEIYLSSGWRDSISIFSKINEADIQLDFLGYPFEKKLIIRYWIPNEVLFDDSVQVLPQINLNENRDIDATFKESTSQSSSVDLFGNSNLNKSGSLTRGITVGSNQDASLESGLRLDINGEIADSIFFTANLTDQSTPIQPDGSTQNLREFDRVYLQLRSPKQKLEIGDVDVQFNESEFARINRRLQGAYYQTNAFNGKYKFVTSLARGLFRNQIIQAVEGVQGPYRLTGGNGEPFIVVIAGTEKIYIDGRLLTRGESNDYVIDYSLGEFTINPSIPINQRNRIVVDFQYLNVDYSRTFTAVQAISDPLLNDRIQIGATYMQEADDDNNLAQISITDAEREIIAQAGDDESKAVISGVSPYDPLNDSDLTPYTRRDTTINGNQATYFIASPGTSLGDLFRIRFSRVENGSYTRSQSGLNGIVFEFVGAGNGNYDTLRVLPRPIDHKMLTLQGQAKITSGLSSTTEWALNMYDENRFSDLDTQNDDDHAFIQRIDQKYKTDAITIESSYSYKYSGENFRYFDRPEDVEFIRRWNLNSFYITEQHIQNFKSMARWGTQSNANLDLGYLSRTDVTGSRYRFVGSQQERNQLNVSINSEYTQSDDKRLGTQGDWFNHNGKFSYPIKWGSIQVDPFIVAGIDQRSQKITQNDSLVSQSYAQQFAEIGLELDQNQIGNWSYSIKKRDDLAPYENELEIGAKNWIHSFSLKKDNNQKLNYELRASYQSREITSKFLNDPSFVNTDIIFLYSKINWQSKNRAVDAQWVYDVNSERSALLQETFIDVGPELGQYVWLDSNNDNIRQIDEFFPEQTPNEGVYVKQYLPSDNFLPTVQVQSRFRLNLTPAKWFKVKNQAIHQKVLKELEYSFYFDVREKSTTDNLSDMYLLNLSRYLNDSTTVIGRIQTRNEFRIFPKNRFFNVYYNLERTDGLNRQTFGIEKSTINSHSLRVRSRLKRKITWQNEIRLRENSRVNDQLTNRNINISEEEFRSVLQVINSSSIQYGLEIGFSRKEDTSFDEGANSRVVRASGNLRWFIGDKILTSSTITFRNVDLNGQSSGFGNFELTEGVGDGNNWVWSLQATYRNSSWVQTSFSYDGRTVTNAPTIQTARLIVRALF